MVKEIGVREAAKIANRNVEQVRRWIREGKLPARRIWGGNKLFIKEIDVDSFYIKRKIMEGKGQDFFGPEFLHNFVREIAKSVEEYFGEEPGCLMTEQGSGILHVLALYAYLIEKGKDVTFAFLPDKKFSKPDLWIDRKVLLVNCSNKNKESIESVKSQLEKLKVEKVIKDMKEAVHYDFGTTAPDFSVEKLTEEEYLQSLTLAIK